MGFSFEFVHSEAAGDSALIVEHDMFSDRGEKSFVLRHHPGKTSALVAGTTVIPLDGLEDFDFGEMRDVVLIGFAGGGENPLFTGFAKVEVYEDADPPTFH